MKIKMKTELRECPFCGERTFVKFTPLEGCTDIGNITCVCGFVYTTISQGLDDWNVRPIEDGLRAEIEALQQELDELKEQYRWHSLEKDGLPELNQDVQLWSYTYREIRIGHFYDYEEGNKTSPDIWFDDYDRCDCFRLDELPKKYQWRYLNAPKGGE